MSAELPEDIIFPMIPSPMDKRDLIYENIINRTRNSRSLSSSHLIEKEERIPEALDLRPFLPKPRNQGQRGTCGAFSASAIKEYQERKDVDFDEYMSPESIYFYRHDQTQSGMFARNIMKILHHQGIAPESLFPYNYESDPQEIPSEAVDVMSNYKIKHYALVSTIEGAKKALQDGPLLITVPVFNNSPTIWKPKNYQDEIRGGHAMVIVAYDEKGFIIRNSWGPKWNQDGHVNFPYEDFGKHWEIWTSVDEETYQESLPKPRKKFFCF